MGAIAFGDEIQVAILIRVHNRMERVNTWHGNGRRRQAVTGVGVVRRIGAQVPVTDIAVKPLSQAINNGRVCLQAHPPAQALNKDARDFRPFVCASGLLFHNRRKNQGLVRRFQRQSFLALLPCLGQPVSHGIVGALEKGGVGGPCREIIGIRQEPPLGVLACMTKQGHDFSSVGTAQGRLDKIGFIDTGKYFPERLSFYDHP